MIKKHSFFILIALPIFWYLIHAKNYNRLAKPNVTFVIDSTRYLSKFDFNYVKSKTSKIENHVDVYTKVCKLKNRIPKAFISKFLSSQKTVIGDQEYLDPNNFDAFCFKAYKEFPAYNLFTFTYENGTCCKTLYAVTTEKKSLKIINMGAIAFTGDESGWLGDKYGKWISNDIMDMMTISYYDDDFNPNNNNSRIDTTWSIIRIDKLGFFKEYAYKRVRYLDGRKIE
ncbi:hypothetical protein GCM10022291_26290 [Postechiella marina]|uniref:Uncharacterized protein n=1 Tax=Postechiella marina TaxID=943941 RepID=A0ABP8CDE7_9FLAO